MDPRVFERELQRKGGTRRIGILRDRRRSRRVREGDRDRTRPAGAIDFPIRRNRGGRAPRRGRPRLSGRQRDFRNGHSRRPASAAALGFGTAGDARLPPTSGRTTSDADGRYSIGGLQDGDYLVQTFDFGSYSGSSSHSRPVTIAGDTTLDIDLPTLSLTGTVVELGSSDPVPGVLVSLDDGASPSTMTQPQTTTDSGGRFRLDGLGSGAMTLSATKREWQTFSQPLTLEDASPELTIPLLRAEGISIHVADGRTALPLSSIQALFLSEAGAVAFDGPVALDSSGRGEIPSAFTWVSLRLFSQGYAPQSPGSISIPTPPLAGFADTRRRARHPVTGIVRRSPRHADGRIRSFLPVGRVPLRSPGPARGHSDSETASGPRKRPPDGAVAIRAEEDRSLQIIEGRTTVVEIP